MDLPLSNFRRMAIEEFDISKLLAHAAQQASKRGYKNFPIVDVDSHHYELESLSEILEFMDDPVIQQLAQSANQSGMRHTGVFQGGVGYQDMGGRVMRYPLRKIEKTDGAQHRDITLSKRWMDAMGVDVAVMFPTPMLTLGLHPQIEVEVAMARAYNRWLTERVLASEPRLRSMLYLPFNDAEASFRMVQEFGGRQGLCGFMVTAARHRPIHHNSFIKTYALLEAMGLPLGFHAGYNWNEQSMEMMNKFISVHAIGFVFYNMVHLTNWIMNGLAGTLPQAQSAVDRERARLGAVHDAAARQRVHDALLGSAGAEAVAERLYARDVFLDATDGDHRHGRAGADLPHDESGNPAALFVRLPALGFRSAVNHLRPAVS